MNILVLIGEVAYISRSETMNRLVECAKADNNNIFLFTSEGLLYNDLTNYSYGEYNIFRLPDMQQFDGIIVEYNSIFDEQIKEYIRKKVVESGKPCVSFECSERGASTISYNTVNAFGKMVEHLIVKHECKDIHFIAGPKENPDSIKRRDMFISVLGEYGLDTSDDNIHYGDFNIGSGKNIVDSYVRTGRKLPDAFVAANDFMAIGCIEALTNNGYRVPEDVAVVGVDNTAIGQKMLPKLTTVDTGVTEAGEMAYNELIALISDKAVPQEICIDGSVVYGQSCGCNFEPEIGVLNNEFTKVSMRMDQSLDLIKALCIRLADVTSYVEFQERLEPLVSRMGMDYFYYMQCGTRESYYQELEMIAKGLDIDRDINEFTDEVWCPVSYEKGRWSSYPVFDIKNLLPPDRMVGKGVYYIVMPVHRERECIGYVVMGNFNEKISGRVLQHLVLGLDRLLGNIRQNDITSTMLAQINDKWQYDELTKLFNRSGMHARVKALLSGSEEKTICVQFYDLDGLKAINDTKGHKEGDRYIRQMADALLAISGPEDVAARYGGDEFLVISAEKSEDECQERFKKNYEFVNTIVSASAGLAIGRIRDNHELKKLIEKADKAMYEQKFLRKKNR